MIHCIHPVAVRSLIALAMGFSLILCFGAPAFAQATSPTVQVSSTMTTTAAVQVTPCITETVKAASATTSNVIPEKLPWFILMTLVFASLVLGLIFWYTYQIQMKYYTTSERLSRAGILVEGVSTEPFSETAAKAQNVNENKTSLTITGPGIVTVGALSEEFIATLKPDDEEDKIEWSVTPAKAATILPARGPKVKLIAATAGAYKVTATINEATSAEVMVAAVEPKASGVQLPFIGSGYGTLTIAVVLLAAVIVLGLAGILSGEGVATLLGGLLGYIFGVKGSEAEKKAE